MKNKSRKFLFVWVLITAVVAGGTFLLAEHLGWGTTPAVQSDADAGSVAQPDADIQADNSSSGAASVPVAMQTFSNDGYAFTVPASWNIERTATDTIALHSDASSSDVACKIEVSAFPFASGIDTADWIAHRIGADPSLAVVEQSSNDVSFRGGTGVQWVGTIDGIPTTLVYAFNDDHAYEIAPSVIGEGAAGDAPCSDMLQSFLSTLTI